MSGSWKSHRRFGTRSTQVRECRMMTSGKEEIPGFQRFDHKASVQVQSGEMAIDHPVFFAGKGPAILLMHELPGLAQPCVDFAMRLIAADFEVFMPQLIGPLLRYEPWRNVARLCISAEFARLRAGEAAPIADWLRDLARRISIERNQARIGAIGMCLTGAFVIPLLLEPEDLAEHETSEPRSLQTFLSEIRKRLDPSTTDSPFVGRRAPIPISEEQ